MDLEQLRLVTEACSEASGLATTIFDARDASVLASAGWQDLFAEFHRRYPGNLDGCRDSVRAFLAGGAEERAVPILKNGLRHVGIPMFIEGTHAATFSLTQFLLETDDMDREFFKGQAEALGFDQEACRRALDALPVLSRGRVDAIIHSSQIFSRLIAAQAESTLRINRERAAGKRVQSAVRDQAAINGQLVDAIANPLFIKDKNGIYTGCNTAFAAFMGLKKEDILGKGVFDLSDQAEASVYHQKDMELMARGGVQVYDFTVCPQPGECREVQFSKAVMHDSSQGVLGIVGVITDITELKLHEKALRESEEQFRFLAEHSIDIIWRLDARLTVAYASPADERMRGFTPQEVVGQSLFDMVHADHVKQLRASSAGYLGDLRAGFTQAPFRVEAPLVCRNGKRLWVEILFNPIRDNVGAISGFHCVARDVGARKAREEEQQFLRSHDGLTGLYNRAHFDAEFKRIGQGRGYPLSLIIGDVDGLKDVNDTDGHAAGDRLLRGVGEVFRAVFREGDLVARMGDDEFAVLLPKAGAQAAQEAIARIREEQERFNRKHAEFAICLSMGSATATSRHELDQLFPTADWLMCADKAANKGCGCKL